MALEKATAVPAQIARHNTLLDNQLQRLTRQKSVRMTVRFARRLALCNGPGAAQA